MIDITRCNSNKKADYSIQNNLLFDKVGIKLLHIRG